MTAKVAQLALGIALQSAKLVRAGWVQGHWAVDSRGLDVKEFSKDAVRFCASGACTRATYDVTGNRNPMSMTDEGRAKVEVRQRLQKIVGQGIVFWNDSSYTAILGKEAVAAAFDAVASSLMCDIDNSEFDVAP